MKQPKIVRKEPALSLVGLNKRVDELEHWAQKSVDVLNGHADKTYAKLQKTEDGQILLENHMMGIEVRQFKTAEDFKALSARMSRRMIYLWLAIAFLSGIVGTFAALIAMAYYGVGSGGHVIINFP
jgi:uncharacterized linocin/CFP29 family protein